MIDSHCHLNFHAFEPDHAAVVARAKAAGVEAIVAPSTDIGSSEQAIRLAAEYPGWLFPAVGHHPTHVIDRPFDINVYRKLANDPTVVAIGEIGLDAHRAEARATLLEQQAMLQALLDLAVELNKPVILHCRNAYEELLAMLQALPVRPAGVLHCFAPVAGAGYTGGQTAQAVADAFLELGYAIGFTGIVTYPKNEALQAVAASLPLNRMLVETDAPFLSPQRYRSERNEPAFLAATVTAIAELRREPIELVANETATTASKLLYLEGFRGNS